MGLPGSAVVIFRYTYLYLRFTPNHTTRLSYMILGTFGPPKVWFDLYKARPFDHTLAQVLAMASASTEKRRGEHWTHKIKLGKASEFKLLVSNWGGESWPQMMSSHASEPYPNHTPEPYLRTIPRDKPPVEGPLF